MLEVIGPLCASVAVPVKKSGGGGYTRVAGFRYKVTQDYRRWSFGVGGRLRHWFLSDDRCLCPYVAESVHGRIEKVGGELGGQRTSVVQMDQAGYGLVSRANVVRLSFDTPLAARISPFGFATRQSAAALDTGENDTCLSFRAYLIPHSDHQRRNCGSTLHIWGAAKSKMEWGEYASAPIQTLPVCSGIG
ncbi:hypothetical protein BC826DRAFT_152736 [Russula brevipes]|nr:hypothetical protein BC826DRAFT_152736 [Russula brevipes]